MSTVATPSGTRAAEPAKRRSAEERAKRLRGWNKAVRCVYHWALDEED